MSQALDLSNPFWVTPAFAESRVQNAWIAQCLNNSWISRVIQYGTQGAHSHSAMFLRNGGNRVDILELREFKGGRRKTFAFHMQQATRIDVFSPDLSRWPEFDSAGAVNAMRNLTDCNYGYLGILRMILRRVPLAWRLYPPTTDDHLPAKDEPVQQPFCSHAVSLATHLGGGVDPVPRCPHHLVTPSHLTQSLFYEYEFSIANPWCVQLHGKDILTKAIKNEALLITSEDSCNGSSL